MKPKFLLLCFIHFFIVKTIAQDTLCFNQKYVVKNNVTLELGGSTVFYSLNYERNFLIKNKSFNTLRVGISYCNGVNTSANIFYLPFNYSYSIGKNKSKFFFGLGLTFLVSPSPYPSTFSGRKNFRQHAAINSQPPLDTYQPLLNMMICPMLGYEYISKKLVYFKIYVNGLLFNDEVLYYRAVPWAGFTFGLKLNKKTKK